MLVFLAFFTLFHLSLTFFRPEVPFNIVREHIILKEEGRQAGTSVCL